MKQPPSRLSVYPLFIGLLLLSLAAVAVAAEKSSPQVKVIYPVKYGISQPLRDMKAPLRPLRITGEDAALSVGYPERQGGQQPRQPEAPARDSALQQSGPIGTMPVTSMNFEGLNNIAGYYPPDTCGDVGPNDYVQITNVYYQVYDKATGAAKLPAALPNNAMWTGFGGVCETTNDGDPIVLYDQFADRWLFSQFSIGGPYHQCIAISQTGDPTGAWYLYDYQMSTTIMNDYPKFGVWPDGYYMAINQFLNASSWAGQGVVAFDRAAMMTGAAAPMIYLDLFAAHSDLGAMLPADADGSTPPPTGTPNYFVQMDNDAWGYPADQLEIYEFSVDWTTPANSTFTKSAVSPLVVAPFNTLNRTTVPQPGTSQQLDNLGDRLMYRLQYRNFGTHQSMVVNHTIDTTGTGTGVAGIRWYELRDTGSNWAIHQQGTYVGDAANTEHRWMGSIAMDSQGNMGLGYSVSNATTYPSIRYVGRLAGDTAGTLPQGESSIIVGSGSQTGTAARWGDYSMMSVDPVDDCTFWYTQEYYQTTSSTGWQTRIASFKFPGCTAGPSGMLDGTVTDSAAAPVEGATITADNGGAIQLTSTTAADGSFSFASVPVGTYTVTADKYGYVSNSATGVVIADGVTTTQDFVLADATFYTLSGTVTDANTGWPLYAEVDYGVGSQWTDPVTGMYSVDLSEGTLSVTATADSYATAGATVNLNSDTVKDFGLQADTTCSAPGYSPLAVLAEDFDDCGLPSGWTVNNLGGTCDWLVTDPDPGSQGNLTGGTGCFADADSDECGSGTTMNTELITPLVDCSSLTAVTLEFKYDVNDLSNRDTFEVDVSIDGGGSWINVWDSNFTDDRGPKTAQVDITALAAGQASVQVRFHYIAPDWDWWWQVDDVFIYENESDKTTCITPTDGGFVVGNVFDANTNDALNGALVDDGAGHSVTTAATPDDDNLDDGFYSMYLPTSGNVALTVTENAYGTGTANVNVPVLGTVRQDFGLGAGILSADPNPVEVHIALNATLSAALSMDNTGSYSGDFELHEVDAAPPTRPNGPFADVVRHVSPKHLHDMDAGGARYDYPVPEVPIIAVAGDVVSSWASGLAIGWGTGYQNLSSNVWLSNPAGWGGDGFDYEFDTTGTATGNTIDVSGIGAISMADFAYDWVNGTLWQVAVGGDNCVHELDTDTLTVTGNSICPSFGTSQRGLAYNPVTDTFYAGGWNDSTIHEFDRGGTILRSTNVGLAISGLAFNPSTEHIFVMVNDLAANPEIYVVDVPATGDFVVSGQFDIAVFTTDNGGAGLAMGCDGHLWAVDQTTQTVYEVDSGETTDCGLLDIPWLTVTPDSGTVAVGASQPVTLGFDSTGLTVGTEEGYLRTTNSTPYGSFNIPVTMIVEPNQQLDVSIDGSGAGTVVGNQGQIDCGATCSGDYPYDTEVTLTATATTGTFMGWSGDCIETMGTTCSVTMDQARNVTAFFTNPGPSEYELGVSLAGSGTGGVVSSPAGISCGTAGSTCTSLFDDGLSVTLTATAAAGNIFMGWSGACSGNDTCTVNMDQAHIVSATFTDIVAATNDLAVNVTGNGTGGVTSSPVGIFCGTSGTTCTAPFDDGVSITLTAAPATGTIFSGWIGDCSGSSLTCNLTMDQDYAATALFSVQSFDLTVIKAGKGDGTVTSDPAGIDCGSYCSQSYDYGSQVVLTAAPDEHSALAGWLGSCNEPLTDPPSPTCTVDIQQVEDIMVTFDHVFYWPMFLPAITGEGK